jgi:hypothetical protein
MKMYLATPKGVESPNEEQERAFDNFQEAKEFALTQNADYEIYEADEDGNATSDIPVRIIKA